MPASTTQPDPRIIKLTNVRLSYPQLFEAKAGPDGGKPKFSASFLMDKVTNAAVIAAINKAIDFVVREDAKGKRPVPKMICLHDGSEKEGTDGYGAGVMFVSARSDQRPGVVGPKLERLEATDGKPYAGCYVNATIRLWYQDNKFGKRVNAALRNVQFLRDGDPFGASVAAPEEEFSEEAEASVDDGV